MKKILPLIFPVTLILIALFLCFKSYSPGSFLIGWDSLHPEFNFSEAFKRVFWGVWREEQGLGAQAIHSHMADWPRVLFLWLSSIVIPISFLRYFYIFLCLVLGPLGVYFFLNYVFKRESDHVDSQVGAFLGGLYYLLNLGTLQHFIVPFEMFTTQYAFLPWLFLFGLKFLREGKSKNLIFFALLTLISSPQAYAATLFYAYLGAFTIFVLLYNFKRGFILVTSIILLNLYWILPNLYSVLNESSVVLNAKINLLFSPEAYLRNLSFANLKNVLIHKSFLFDWSAFNFETGRFGNLIHGNWNLRPFAIIASFSLMGAVISVLKKSKIGLLFVVMSGYCLFFLLGLYPQNGVLGEALRMPFTKFSIIFMFSLSFFFGYFFFKMSKKRFIGLILALIVSSGLLFSMKPIFQGQVISPIVETNLPQEYVDLFTWFEGKEGRIATLPLNTLWGWDYHSWNYEGSGFLTYGLSNPLLIRDFDRWSQHNETFYSEAAFALYANDNEAFESTIQKYQVKYLLLDESMVNPGGSSEILYVQEIKDMTKELGFKEVAKFNFLTVYDTGNESQDISVPQTYSFIDANLTYSQVDPVYPKHGDYLQKGGGFGYPFINFDERGDVTVQINDKEVEIKNERMSASVVLPLENPVKENFDTGRGFPEGYNCDIDKTGNVQKTVTSNGFIYRAEDGGVECDFLEYPSLIYNQAYFLRIKGVNKEGRSLKIYLQNWLTNRMDLEELLPEGEFDKTYFIHPKEVGGKGYSLNLETRSFGRISSENVVSNIEFYSVDYDFLSNIFTGESEGSVKNSLKVKEIKKYGPAIYIVQTEGDGVLTLNQGFEKGWLAFKFEGSKFNFLEHFEVNSWANGWVVSSNRDTMQPSNQIFIFFWPQALEYFGFLIITPFLGFILIKSLKELRRILTHSS